MGALLAAPTAMGLNDFMLYMWNDTLTDPHVKATYLGISWFSFFLHSIGWKYLLRRIFIKYQWEPKMMWSWLVKKFNQTFKYEVKDKDKMIDGHLYTGASYWTWKWNK